MPSDPSQADYLQTAGDLSLAVLLEKIEALELSSIGEGKRIRFGTGTAEWTAKGHESANTTVTTGLTTIEAFIAFGEKQVLIGVAEGAVGGKIGVSAYQVAGEVPIGVKTNFYWIAIGT